MPVWTIGPAGPDGQQLQELEDLLLGHEVLVLPTDTIYGLHGLAADAQAVDRIFELKGRSREKSLPVLVSSLEQLREAGVDLHKDVEECLGAIWPAPMTAILPLMRPMAAAPGRTVAARIPALPWLRQLIAATGPLASTSANQSGEAPTLDPSSLPAAIASGVAGIADAGTLRGTPSTIIDFTEDPPRVVRPGEFFFTQNLWKKARKTL